MTSKSLDKQFEKDTGLDLYYYKHTCGGQYITWLKELVISKHNELKECKQRLDDINTLLDERLRNYES